MHDHIMLDLETLGLTPGSVVAAIGAITFDPFGTDLDASFYTRIDLGSATRAGLTVDGGTVAWWLTQSDEARCETFAGDAADLDEALIAFRDWVPRDAYVWSMGPSFDVSIIEAAYRAVNDTAPWSHRRVVDVRTIGLVAELLGIKALKPRPTIPHHARADAASQALMVQNVMRMLRHHRPDRELLRMIALQAKAYERGTYPDGAEAVPFLTSDLTAIAGHVDAVLEGTCEG